MRFVHASALATALALVTAALPGAQAQDPDKKVAGGGIQVPGWKGKVDAAAAKKGMAITDSKFVKQGDDLHLTGGPPAIYWNPTSTASGDYTVKATFTEGKMTASHPHPAGIFIGGSNLDTDQQKLMYCVAYGDGSFLIRQFNGVEVVTVAKRQPHEAVNKAGADGAVSNEVGWTVKGGRAECVINGKPVAGFDRSEITGAGKLDSTDGVVGIRVAHNMNVVVSGWTLGKS